MKIYLISSLPIATLREKYANGAPADFLLEDLVQVAQLNDTCSVDELEIALSKLNNNKVKFIYEIDVKEVK